MRRGGILTNLALWTVALFAMVLLAPLMRSITPPKMPSADAH